MGIYHFFVLLLFLFVGDKFVSSITTRTTSPTHHPHQLLHSTAHSFPREEARLIPHISKDKNEDCIYMKQKCPHSFSSEIEAMVDIVQGFQWHEIIFIHQDSQPSNQFASQLVDAFKDKEILISNKISISNYITYSSTLKILRKISNTQSRIILVDVTNNVTLGSRLILAAKEAGLMRKGYAWLITSRMSTLLNSMDQNTLSGMEGALGIRPHLPISTPNSIMENVPRGYSGNNTMHSLSNNLEQKILTSFEVFNVLGKVERVVGFWSPDFGFFRDLGTTIDDDGSVKNFKKIIWPGDSTIVPCSCDVPIAIRTRGPWRGVLR